MLAAVQHVLVAVRDVHGDITQLAIQVDVWWENDVMDLFVVALGSAHLGKLPY